MGGYRRRVMTRRPRVIQTLQERSRGRLLVVEGESGSGKTVAVQQMMRDSHRDWLYWCESQVHVGTGLKWRLFCEMIKTWDSGLGEKMAGYGIPDSLEMYSWLSEQMERHINDPVTLVLDDWQNCRDERLERLLEFVVLKGPEVLHIILITQDRSRLPTISAWGNMVDGTCLAFDSMEVAALFAENGFFLKAAETDEILRITQGRAAMVYLMLGRFQAGDWHSVGMKVSDLMRRYVLDVMPRTDLDQLITLAPLEEIYPEMAESLTGTTGIRILLQHLAAAGCFLSWDRFRGSYRIHTLLQNILLERLSKKEIRDILWRSARWFEEKGRPVEAICSYCMVDAVIPVLNLMAKRGASEYYEVIPQELDRIFLNLKKKQWRSHSIAVLNYLHCVSMADDSGWGEEQIGRMETYYLREEKLPQRRRLLGELYAAKSFAHFNSSEMSRLQKKAWEYLGGQCSLLFNEQMVFTFGAVSMLYLYHNGPGRVRELVEERPPAFQWFVRLSGGCGAGAEHLLYAEWHYEKGDLEVCRRYLEQADHKAAYAGQVGICLAVGFQYARRALELGEWTEFWYVRGRIQDSFERWSNPVLVVESELALLYLQGVAGEPMDIPSWLTEPTESHRGLLRPCKGWKDIVHCMALWNQGRYVELEMLAEAMLDAPMAGMQVYVQIYALLFQAIGQMYSGKRDLAATRLMEAVKLAEHDQISSPFLDLRKALLPLLEDCGSAYARRLATRCRSWGGKIISPPLLSARECEVMELVAQGYKQSELADKLCVSLNTVKKHMDHIYEKLDVHSRAEALKAYRIWRQGH